MADKLFLQINILPNKATSECVFLLSSVGDILSLSLKGMGIIEQLDPTSFTNYLKKYRNTICGRHPIGVLLNVSVITQQHHQVFAPLFLFSTFTHSNLKTACAFRAVELPQQVMMLMNVRHKRNV